MHSNTQVNPSISCKDQVRNKLMPPCWLHFVAFIIPKSSVALHNRTVTFHQQFDNGDHSAPTIWKWRQLSTNILTTWKTLHKQSEKDDNSPPTIWQEGGTLHQQVDTWAVWREPHLQVSPQKDAVVIIMLAKEASTISIWARPHISTSLVTISLPQVSRFVHCLEAGEIQQAELNGDHKYMYEWFMRQWMVRTLKYEQKRYIEIRLLA